MESLTASSHHDRRKRSASESDAVLTTKLKFTSDETRNTSVVVAFVYQNPEGVLPLNAQSASKEKTRKAGRRKIKAINSPVVTIRTYNGDSVNQKRNSLVLNIPNRKPAYRPKCVTMIFNKPGGAWKTNKCTVIESKSNKHTTTCMCSQPIIAAVEMAMGAKPLPFIVAARDGIIATANLLSFLLILLSSVLIYLSGLDTEQYYVIRHYVISFLPMPLFVFLGVVSRSVMINNISTAVIQFSLLSTTAWTMNLSIESYRRLACYIYSSKRGRFLYFLNGWVAPSCVMILCLWIRIDVYSNRQTFWFPTVTGFLVPCIFMVTIMNLISTVLLILTKRCFDRESIFYGFSEWQKFWYA
ncbi:adhesion G protein-coupled receptor L2-like [Ptychodera flava]|uniref:adhesion G protein-coupled receptor L2-like n=1 Tax=Ptychodera flava TaxID=63121 RepID=UPI003969F8C4